MGVKEEKARQSCFCWTKTGRTMAPVKPSRCTHMFEENSAFSKRLTKAEMEIKALKKAADALIVSTEKTLSSSLPSDYEQDAEGNVHRVPGTGEPIIPAGNLPRSKSAELQEHVYSPIDTWQTEHNRMKSRMGDLNAQRLRLDEARRKHYKAHSKHIQDNVMQEDNVHAMPKGEPENPDLVSARTVYQKIEAEVHAELAMQGTRAREVQEYLTTAMQIQAARLNEAAAVHSNASMGQQPMMQQPVQHAPMQQQPVAVHQSSAMHMSQLTQGVPHLRT